MIYYSRSILRLLVNRKNLAEIWGVVEFYALTAPWNALEKLMYQVTIKGLLLPQEYLGILEE